MSEAIKRTDIEQKPIFPELQKEIAAAAEVLKKYDETLKSVAKTYQTELSKAEKISAANMQKLLELLEKSNKLADDKKNNTKKLTEVEKEQLRLQKAVAKERAAANLATSAENKQLQKLRAEKNKTNKAIRDEIKAVDRSKNAYTKLSDESRRLKNESKRLGAELLDMGGKTRKNRVEWNRLEKQYLKTTSAARTTDKQLKTLDRRVGDNFRNVGNYKTALQGLQRTLGALGVATGVGAIVRNVGGTIASFDQAQTDLAAISGKTSDELSVLTKQARELGKTTQFSATEVTGLQIELAKLGFTTQEITDSTGGIANFAAATGVEIPRAAALAGSALRAFNLDAKEIDRVVSTLGVATTKSALDFSKLEAGLSTVAPVAASFGFSIEDTTALLGQLSNAGFDASSAATATRNILLNLADANGELAKQLGRPIKTADDLAAGLQELKAKGVDLAQALELTDKRSVAAFSTFIENSDTLVTLRDNITDANDELEKMAKERLNSVQGALQLLSSAWEGYILDLNESIGASRAFQDIIKFVAKNLSSIISIIFRVIRAYTIYRIATSKLGKATTTMVGQLAKANFNIIKFGRGLKSSTTAMNGAKTAAKTLGKAIKSIGFLIAIDLATEFVTSLYEIVKASNAASNAEEERARREELIAAKKARGVLKASNIESKALKDLKELRNNLDLQLAKGTIQQGAYNTALREGIEQTLEGTEQEARQMLQRVQYGRQLEALKEAQKEINDLQKDPALKETLDNEIKQRFRLAMSRKTEAQAAIEGADAQVEALKAFRDSLRQQIVEIDISTAQTKTNTKETRNNTKETKKLTEANNDLFDSYVNVGNILKDINADQEKLKQQAFDESLIDIDRELTKLLIKINDAERLQTITQEEAQEQRLIAEIGVINSRIELYEEFGKDVVGLQLELSERQLELAQLGNEEIIKEAEAAQNELFDIVNSVQKNITKTIEEQTDRRIDALRKEVGAQRDLRNQLTQLAAEGNIDAQNSIKATIEAERKKEAEIARLEKRKQQVQLISQGLETYLSLIENGESPGTAFAQTVITTQGLISFLSGLQGFWTGTDYAPEGMAWTQEKGAEIITDKAGNIKSLGSEGGAKLTYLQKGDKVKNANETANIFKAFSDLDNMNSVPNIDKAGNSYDILAINKLDRIEKAIKNQPHSYTDWEQITRGLGFINNTTAKGGDITRNKHYVRR
jgi:TP901 family phage tail tape measure protein